MTRNRDDGRRVSIVLLIGTQLGSLGRCQDGLGKDVVVVGTLLLGALACRRLMIVSGRAGDDNRTLVSFVARLLATVLAGGGPH